jgi:hypothetical protein
MPLGFALGTLERLKTLQCGPWAMSTAGKGTARWIRASLLAGSEGQEVGKDQGAEGYLQVASVGLGDGRRRLGARAGGAAAVWLGSGELW